MTVMSSAVAGAAGWTVLMLSAAALGQTPSGTVTGVDASAASTDVTSGDIVRAQRDDSEESKDTTTLELSAGGMVATGNSRSVAGTGATRFRLRRSNNQLSSTAAVNFARSAPGAGERMDTTVENLQGRLRYDRFLSERLALFLALQARRDRFQGLDLRLRVDPGVSFYFITEKTEMLWTEVGYDLQYDVRRRANIREAAAEGELIDRTKVEHSGRAYLAYEAQLNDAVGVNLGFEYLQSVENIHAWRLNWEASLTAKLAGGFSTATTLTVLHDNSPLPGVEQTDAMTTFSLVYSLL